MKFITLNIHEYFVSSITRSMNNPKPSKKFICLLLVPTCKIIVR